MRKGSFAAAASVLAASVLAALVLAASGAAAGEETGGGDARAGRETAEKFCAPCHVVAPDQKQATVLKPPAAPLAEIARGPKGDEWTLRTFLASTHSSVSHPGAMPNPQLSAQQILDVTAYILSLRDVRK